MAEEKIHCAFVGLGSQGAPIARRMIAAGFPTHLWARRRETLDPFRNSGACYEADIADLGRKADHVAVCVTDDAAVSEVCGKLLPSMRPGARLVIHSTTLPETCVAISVDAEQRGAAFVEAPVSGGAPGAEAGTLTVMTAGKEDAIALARPVFESFAGHIVHFGQVGAAQTAKLINNALLAANLGLVHSAMAIGTRLGLKRESLLEFLKTSSGRSYALDVYARIPPATKFQRGPTLFEKVEMLAQLTGRDDPELRALHVAAVRLLDQEDRPKSPGL